MKTYELTYIITPQVKQEEAETISKDIETFLQSKEGVILRADKIVAKTLSFRIKKQSSGFFAFVEFQLDPANVLELKEKLQKDSKILRHIILAKLAPRRIKARRERKTVESVFETKAETKPETKPTEELEVKIEAKTETVKEEKPATKKTEKVKKEKIEMEDIDKKLDELLSE